MRELNQNEIHRTLFTPNEEHLIISHHYSIYLHTS